MAHRKEVISTSCSCSRANMVTDLEGAAARTNLNHVSNHVASCGAECHNRSTVPIPRVRRRFVYSIDRCTIFFGLGIYDIRRLINYDHIHQNRDRYARSLTLIPASQEAQMRGHHSQLDIVLPSRDLLEHLSRTIQTNRHTIFSVELACDRLYENQSETRTKQREITKVLRKRWSQDVRIYDASERVPRARRATNSEYQHEMYDDQTTYTGGPNFEYKVYARTSKIAERPCVHCEWTIKSDMMRKRLGVRTIHDLLNLDVKRTFADLYTKYITYEEINHDKHGRFVQNMSTTAPTPGRILQGPRAGARKMHFDRASKNYLRANKIKTSAQLRAHYAKEKRQLQRADRELTAFENRIIRLSTTKLNTFFTTVPDQFFESRRPRS